jgi:hypothetical protein
MEVRPLVWSVDFKSWRNPIEPVSVEHRPKFPRLLKADTTDAAMEEHPMMRILSSVIAAAMLALGVHAQAAPDAGELTRLLKDFLVGASRNDAAIHDSFWAEDLIYTGSSGRRIGKADILRDTRSAVASKPGDPTTTYSAEDIRIQQYGTTAIVAFRLVGVTKSRDKTETVNYLNTGTFLKRNGRWQVVSWQATRMPRASEETRKEQAN